MPRATLDKELQELDAQVNTLGSLVDDALGKTLEALETGDVAKAGMVIEGDTPIDHLRMTVEEHSIRLLTMQQPLGGRDLRFLTSVLAIAGELERTGDGAAGIAQNLLRMMPLRAGSVSAFVPDNGGNGEPQVSEAASLKGLLELGHEARRVLQGTMKAFAQRDARAARYIWEEDDVVDVRYHMVRHDLMAMMAGAHAIPALQSDAKVLQRATYLLWIAHKLERIADHCTNICERVIFIVEGESDMNLGTQSAKAQPQTDVQQQDVQQQ